MVCASIGAYAQTGTGQAGLVYIAVVNTDTGAVVQRQKNNGSAGAGGALYLAADTHYRIWVLQASTLLIGYTDITSPDNGTQANLPPVQIGTDLSPDSDHDGLSDTAEMVVGTDPANPDTNGDGIPDGAEVQAGLDPLGNLAAATGVIAQASGPGTAIDVATGNDLAVLAESDQGVSVFNIFNAMQPVLISQVPTSGGALAVAISSNLVAAAEGAAGLAIIDISNPPQAKLKAEVNLGGVAQAVTTAAGIAYVGLQNHTIYQIDLASATLLDRATTTATVHDLAIEGNTLFALLDAELWSFDLSNGVMTFISKVATSTTGADILEGRRRLFVGGGYALAAARVGFDILSVTNPAAMSLLAPAVSIGPNSFKQIVANGSGVGVAAVGVAPRNDGTQNVSLYDLSKPNIATNFITTFPTPQIAYAVSIYNGLAYVADGANGLSVVNYLGFDTKHVAPTISLQASFPLNPAQAPEGSYQFLSAQVTDDVQVRNVEFYVNGQKVATVGHFPFEYHFLTPPRGSPGGIFRLQARASDTGGNATWSQEYEVTLTPDTLPPALRLPNPAPGGIQGSLSSVTIFFTKPINPATLTTNAFTVVGAGPDGVFGTADDIAIAGTVSFLAGINAAVISFPAPLAAGWYRATMAGSVSDSLGDALGKAYQWRFWAVTGLDSDHDGLPDAVELKLGLNPFNPDSLGDGILDGDRDYDHDGLSNAAELVMGTDPANPHTLDPNILDGDLDLDHDALSAKREFQAGTNPFAPDSDGDGWNDEAEITAGSDPLDPASRPKFLLGAAPPVAVGLPWFKDGLVVANPPIAIGLPVAEPGISLGLTVANPPVSVGIPATVPGPRMGLTAASPPVSVGLPAYATNSPPGITLGLPPVSVFIKPN